MRTAPGEKRDFLWIRAVRQWNPIIKKKKNFQKDPQTNQNWLKPPIYHPHERSQTLITPTLLLSPCHGRNKRQISYRTEREPNLILLMEEILIKKKWYLRSRRQREQKTVGKGGNRIRAVEQRQVFGKFPELWWCFSAWECRTSPTSGRGHQLRSSGQLSRTNQCRKYPWQGQSANKEIWVSSLYWCFLN